MTCCAECSRRFRTGRTPGKRSRISRESRGFGRTEQLADPQHHVARIVPAARSTPPLELRREVAGGLSCQRRVGGSDTLAPLAMARGAGRQPARCIADMIERPGFAVGRGREGRPGRAKRAVESRYRPTLFRLQLAGDVAHLRVSSPAIGIGDKLTLEIAGIEAGKPRRSPSVTLAAQTVAGDTRIRGARPGTAQRDHLAARREALGRLRAHRGAGRQRDRPSREEIKSNARHDLQGTCLVRCRFLWRRHRRRCVGKPLPTLIRILLAFALTTGACKPPPEPTPSLPVADAARGRVAIERVGCGACHTIEGIRWPRGQGAPALAGLQRRGLIAGRLPNRPDVLAAFVRNAPALVPDSAMPAMPLTEREASDVAAYLYEIGR